MQFPSLRVDGQVALITGTGTGIGQASALALAAAGATVVLTGLPDRVAAAGAAAPVADSAYGAGTLAVPLDVTHIDQIEATVARTIERFDRIDILVNNAGINTPQWAIDITEQTWDRILNTNLKGVFFMSQAIGRTMIARRSGKIINIAS